MTSEGRESFIAGLERARMIAVHWYENERSREIDAGRSTSRFVY
jgi:hypothetical protein